MKCYGTLFTCLTCRAVHVEMTESLIMDTFINALRCCIACGGQVKIIHSDNGLMVQTSLGQRKNRDKPYKIELFLQQQGITRHAFGPLRCPRTFDSYYSQDYGGTCQGADVD